MVEQSPQILEVKATTSFVSSLQSTSAATALSCAIPFQPIDDMIHSALCLQLVNVSDLHSST